MRYVLALDQGTTSSRAILFDETGTAGRRRRSASSARSIPQPGWVEHDPEEIWRTQRDVAREALRSAGVDAEDLIGAAASPTSARPRSSGTARPASRSHNAIVWQDRRTAPQCAELQEAGRREPGARAHRPGARSVLLRHQDRVAARQRARARARAPSAASSPSAPSTPGSTWNLTGSRTHVTDASNASRTLLFNIHTGDWDEELLRCSRAARDAARRASLGARLRHGRADACSASRCRSPASPATSRRRCSARPATAPAWRRTPTAPAASCCCTPATSAVDVAATACSPPSRARRRARRHASTRSKAACSSAARWCSGCATGWSSSTARGRGRSARRERARQRRRLPRAGVRRPGRAALGPVRARRDRRPHARHHARAHRARRARIDRLPERRRARGDAEGRGRAADRAARRRRRRRQRPADAVPGRPARRAGGAAEGARDHRARRRLPRRPGHRRLEVARGDRRALADGPALRAADQFVRREDRMSRVARGREPGAELGYSRLLPGRRKRHEAGVARRTRFLMPASRAGHAACRPTRRSAASSIPSRSATTPRARCSTSATSARPSSTRR